MPAFTATFPKLRLYAAVLLVLPLLVSTATAAPFADTHPLAKRQPLASPKPKTKSLASLSAKPLAAPAPVAAAPEASAPVAALDTMDTAAPQTVQVKGIVLAPDGQPCAGASVYPAGAPRQLVVTDAQGAFTLPVSATGPVSLRIDYFGEGSSRVEVPTPGAEPLRITLGK